MSYSNQANRLMGLVKNLENKYNKNEILYNNAVNLIKKYHGDIDQLASNAKVNHANKKLAKLNLAVLKPNGTVEFPVRVWNKYLHVAEQAVQKAINKPTPSNITNAQNKINNVTKKQNNVENIVNKPINTPMNGPTSRPSNHPNGPKNIVPVPNTPKLNNRPNTPANLPKGCDKFGLSTLPNRSAIMKAFANIARSNHSNKGGMGKIDMNELKRCRDEAIAKLPTKPPNKPKNIVPVPNKPINTPVNGPTSRPNNHPNKPKNIVPVPNKPINTPVNGPTSRPNNRPNGPKNIISTNSLKNRLRPKNGVGAGNKFRGLVNRAKAQIPAAPKPPNRKVMTPTTGPAPKPAMSLANQLKAKRNGLKKTGNMAASRFRKNVPRASNRFRGAVSQVKTQSPVGAGNKFRGLVNRAKAQIPAAPKPPNRKVMTPTTGPAPKPAMSLANQLKAKRNGLKKTGNMAASRFRKNVPRASNRFRGAVSQVKTQSPVGAGNKFRGLVNRAKAQIPAAPKPPNRKVMAPTTGPAPKPAMSLANQLKAKRNGLKKTGNMAASRFRKNVPRASNRFRGAVSQVKTQSPVGAGNKFRGLVNRAKAQIPAAPKPPNRKVMAPTTGPAPKPAMSLANQIAAQKRGLKPVGARAAPQFRRNVGPRGAAKFRGAVRGAQAARRFR